MKITSASSAEDYKLCSSFEAVRKKLLEGQYSDRLDKPLAYWALPSDRRLPLAFLGRSLGELLSTPFDELTATRGVGQKKISSLVKLLQRATSNDPPAVPFGLDELRSPAAEDNPHSDAMESHGFDSAMVSEVLWDQWRELLMRHAVGREKLGRLAPTLQSLPTVIWHTPLDHYLEQSLADIRNFRTHGEKRVSVVLEVVHSVYEALAAVEQHPHLAIHVLPKFVPPIEYWLLRGCESGVTPTVDEVREQLASPLLGQTLIDAGETVYRLAEGRLGVREAPRTVRDQAQALGVTRARVYQLLEECARVMQVRWPEGKALLTRFVETCFGPQADRAAHRLFDAVRDLFFPEKEIGSAPAPSEERETESIVESSA